MLILFPNKRFQKKKKRETKPEICETSESLVVERQKSPVGNHCFTTGISISSEGIVGNAKGH